MKNNLFVEEYNKANRLNIKDDLNLYDECEFSYLDILKGKEVEVISKSYSNCRCIEHANFSVYYNKCNKCNGRGTLSLAGNDVICNHCKGTGRIIREVCPLCEGEGKVVKDNKVVVKLSKELKNGDTVVIKGKGKYSNGLYGDLYIKIMINDLERFEIVNNDVYDRRMIDFSKEEISKGVSKVVETIKGSVKIKSSGMENEIIKLEGQGINQGNFYVCLNNELTPIRGLDVYKNVIVKEGMLGIYINKEQVNSDKKCLNVYYYRRLNDQKLEYIDLGDANNFKIVKIKEKGLEGKNGGVRGDLYLRVFFEGEFICVDDNLYYKPIILNKYEIVDGRKTIEFNKNRISLNYPKNLNELKEIEVKDYGFIVDKNKFDSMHFVVNPFGYEIYRVSITVNKKDKIVYLNDYKNYFFEEINFSRKEGLKVVLNRKNYSEVYDSEGNKVIVRIIR